MKTKNYILLLFICILSFSFTKLFQNNEAKIIWSKDRQLTWDDFKGKPIKGGQRAAFTDSGMDLQFSYEGENQLLKITSHTYFLKNRSSVNPEKKSDEILKHEQGHFDISEIYSRKLHKNIMEEKLKEKILNKKMAEIASKYKNELDKFQDLYDKETNHSINKEKQLDWNNRIAKQLKELEKYAEPDFSVELK